MVELGCGKSCMKYILFVINFLFFLLGAAALALGIWALVDKNKMNVLAKVGADSTNLNVIGLLETAAIVLLVGGAAVLIIGFLGCCGAMKQNKCLLTLYTVFLILILIIEIAAIVLAAVFRGKVTDEMKTFLKNAITTRYEGKVDTAEEFSLGVDYAQVYFGCCGIDSYTDFYTAQHWNRTATGTLMIIPPSCCVMKDKDEFLKNQKYNLVNTQCPYDGNNSNKDKPCWDSIQSFLKSRIAIVIGIACGVAALEIICVIFACCIISELRKD